MPFLMVLIHRIDAVDDNQAGEVLVGRQRFQTKSEQEAAGALPTDEVGGVAVDEHRVAADEHGADGVIVAVDHAGQAAILLDPFLGVLIE